MSTSQTRSRIVNAADQLFYEQGFEHTSFAQIAEAVGISRGNFYYHFKTKGEILDAVISQRLANTSDMFAGWELGSEEPADRIRSFINIVLVNRSKIMRYGCPVGTLCTELAKLNHPANEHANELFTLFRTWLRHQFELAGRKDEADELAMHVLAFSQGVATLSAVFQDDTFIHNEVNRIENWLSASLA